MQGIGYFERLHAVLSADLLSTVMKRCICGSAIRGCSSRAAAKLYRYTFVSCYRVEAGCRRSGQLLAGRLACSFQPQSIAFLLVAATLCCRASWAASHCVHLGRTPGGRAEGQGAPQHGLLEGQAVPGLACEHQCGPALSLQSREEGADLAPLLAAGAGAAGASISQVGIQDLARPRHAGPYRAHGIALTSAQRQDIDVCELAKGGL